MKSRTEKKVRYKLKDVVSLSVRNGNLIGMVVDVNSQASGLLGVAFLGINYNEQILNFSWVAVTQALQYADKSDKTKCLEWFERHNQFKTVCGLKKHDVVINSDDRLGVIENIDFESSDTNKESISVLYVNEVECIQENPNALQKVNKSSKGESLFLYDIAMEWFAHTKESYILEPEDIVSIMDGKGHYEYGVVKRIAGDGYFILTEKNNSIRFFNTYGWVKRIPVTSPEYPRVYAWYKNTKNFNTHWYSENIIRKVREYYELSEEDDSKDEEFYKLKPSEVCSILLELENYVIGLNELNLIIREVYNFSLE
jgi:hypothetical protein